MDVRDRVVLKSKFHTTFCFCLKLYVATILVILLMWQERNNLETEQDLKVEV